MYTFFFYQDFFFTDTDDSQDSREMKGTIFYSILPFPHAHEHSDIYLQLRMWDDYHIFLIVLNRTCCIYQTASRWDLPPSRITIWLIDDVILIFVCLLDDLILGYCYSNFDTGNRLTRTRISCHSFIKSEPTNQVYISIHEWLRFWFYDFCT